MLRCAKTDRHIQIAMLNEQTLSDLFIVVREIVFNEIILEHIFFRKHDGLHFLTFGGNHRQFEFHDTVLIR